ncbi:MAG TPA: MFS transporter [Candidatus Dormibacteraeota bacterium]|nr:MFS transporter [Candidatus Dormibacteraeota bacterium]
MRATKPYARYVLAVMVGINFLNYMDRYIGASVAPSIQRELHISDAAVGFLGSAFLLVYAIAAVPFGLWGDRGARKTVIGVGVAIWSIATLLTGFARNYVQLFLTRGIVGIGEASYYPAGTSLLSDYFPKEQRSTVMAVWGAGATVGIAVGYAGGGIVAEKLGWRAAFFFAAVPGLVFALLAFTMREPLRGAAEQAGKAVAKTAEASVGKFVELLKIPTLRATILAQTLLYFVLASNAFWLPTYLQRRFDMSSGTAGLLAGGVIVAGGLVGILAGGWIADRRAINNPRAHLEVGIVGFIAGAILITVAIVSPQLPVFVPFFFLTVICLYLYQGPFTAVAQNVVSPALRASSVTLLLFVSHIAGDSHSPYDVGVLSDHLHQNMQAALLFTSPTLLIAAAIAAATGLRTVAKDTRRMEEDWARRGETEPAAELLSR